MSSLPWLNRLPVRARRMGASVACAMMVVTAVPVSAQGGLDWTHILGRDPVSNDKPAHPDTANTNATDQGIQPSAPAWPSAQGTDDDPDRVDTKAKGYTICEGAAADAATYIADPLNNWMRVMCPKGAGMYIAPTAGYSWSRKRNNDYIFSSRRANNLDQIVIPEEGYFTSIGIEQLPDKRKDNAIKLLNNVASQLVSSEATRDLAGINDVWRLNTINDLKDSFNLFVFLYQDVPKWMIFCIYSDRACSEYELVRITSPNQPNVPGMPSIGIR